MIELFSFRDTGWGDEILRALAVTIQLVLMTLPVGLVLGFMAAFAFMSHIRPLRYLDFDVVGFDRSACCYVLQDRN